MAHLHSRNCLIYGVPNEIRTRVTAVKGRCPGPLDDGDAGCTAESGRKGTRPIGRIQQPLILGTLSFSKRSYCRESSVPACETGLKCPAMATSAAGTQGRTVRARASYQSFQSR